jgi:hypothetical protein
MTTALRRSPFTLFVVAVAAVLAGIVGLTASAGVVDSMPLAWIVAIAAAGATACWLSRSPALAAAVTAAARRYRVRGRR